MIIEGNSRGDFWKYPNQRYPNNILNYYFNSSKEYKLINSDTKVASMGSCFGIEIAKYLKKLNFNYIVTEKNEFFSARWDKLYNISSIKHVFEYSFGEFKPIVRWWKRNNKVQDPFRRAFNCKPEIADEAFANHIIASYKALSKADVITITLGMVEVWRDKRDKSTYWRTPPKEYFDPEIHEFIVQDPYEVLEEMNVIRSLIPNTKIIWTVSPVPFMATFRQDSDPITANFYSKACLRTSVDMMVKDDDNSFYFPSYEMIILGYDQRYKSDNRHIRNGIISDVMKVFKRMYMI